MASLAFAPSIIRLILVEIAGKGKSGRFSPQSELLVGARIKSAHDDKVAKLNKCVMRVLDTRIHDSFCKGAMPRSQAGASPSIERRCISRRKPW